LGHLLKQRLAIIEINQEHFTLQVFLEGSWLKQICTQIQGISQIKAQKKNLRTR